ncbi:hypothetical protein CYMTET_44073 [Cymbomonas tetramitiformis]|uniref:Uncharacterized protein n=1 Tax=Cymbomonas tetramitiformis TaxID=36881 RepID=A0AAE0C0W8_9CHLO|nr:hypothetical protein CYMTET_44073 [Cymbomonas tetramitiformis]
MLAHQKEMVKQERKQRKVAKRKLAQVRRRGSEGAFVQRVDASGAAKLKPSDTNSNYESCRRNPRKRVALEAATAHQLQLAALHMDMHKATEEAARMQQELLTEVRQEAQRAALESVNEQRS